MTDPTEALPEASDETVGTITADNPAEETLLGRRETDQQKSSRLKRDRARNELANARKRQDWLFTAGSILILLLFVAGMFYWSEYYLVYHKDGAASYLIENLINRSTVKERDIERYAFFLMLTLWALLLIFSFVVIYYFLIRRHILSLETNFAEAETDYRSIRMQTEADWQSYLSEEQQQLYAESISIFLNDDERTVTRQAYVDKQLGYAKTKSEKEDYLGADAAIQSAKRVIALHKQEQDEQRSWRIYAILIMVVYILLAILLALHPAARVTLDHESKHTTYGVPLRVMFWAGIGSLAAILYRFYTLREVIRFDIEVRWLIARPLIGIIMGSMAYLALAAGLILVSSESTSTNPAIRPEIALIVAFLAGFSDRFYEGIVDLLTARFTPNGHTHDDDSPA
ncbi:MAG: hypothetical protein M9928_15840 [Anaerolineae bacterium]|nr:hypothetical protein [Anaerolineae bacterium]MCO5195648.1 hypothetical protein [Anaerolineae bacterium]MCO5206508.1 hypothetical protein [Anaerolineae bacterium]